MNNQVNLFSNSHIRPIHYLGSKLRMLDFIDNTIDLVAPNGGRIYDLFSGSGTVSAFLSQRHPVTAVDIQHYSGLLTKTLLEKSSDDSLDKLEMLSIETSEIYQKMNYIFAPILEQENIVQSSLSDEEMAYFIENCSIIANQRGFSDKRNKYYQILNSVAKNMKDNNIETDNTVAISRLYGGVYFSFEQSIFIDAALNISETFDGVAKDAIIFATLGLASEIVNTVGKHFAQPLSVRNKQGTPKKGIYKRAMKDRSIQPSTIFYEKLNEIIEVKKEQKFEHENNVFIGDFREALSSLSSDTAVVYADPPYTRYHYSRYYHVLETISKHDVPEITTTTTGGITKLSKGLYREDRVQSEFSTISKAPKAFEDLFSLVSSHNVPLILSYSPDSNDHSTTPRVISIEKLEELAKKYFSEVKTTTPGEFKHSKLNKKSTHLNVIQNAEILIIMK
ncbi:DNA methyltransferase [Listeria monocytogenes]|nr:DNA methyltransferase [Listeria monocytogenes]